MFTTEIENLIDCGLIEIVPALIPELEISRNFVENSRGGRTVVSSCGQFRRERGRVREGSFAQKGRRRGKRKTERGRERRRKREVRVYAHVPLFG